MTQIILNFKLQSTNKKLTSRTAVAILKSINPEELCNSNLLLIWPKIGHFHV